ncbi:MAG: DUF502 domain-containing protein [Thiobacillaceae bacterium]|jgi:uncharacterized membrane protein|nr:DUF502 domain-containing protein [Thiobacillaceae bacterium]
MSVVDHPGNGRGKGAQPHVLRHILIGFFTLAPLWVTWLVLDFLFSLLARTGAPLLRGAARVLRPFSETLADWLLNPTVQYLLAALVTLAGLYAVGLLTSLVLGRRMIAFLERQVGRLPLVQTIYGATKRFLETLRQPPVAGQRVVLISFPSPEMKALGLVTKVMRDPDTGRELAAVYVPTSPNPTSGYIEIVPLDEVVQTDWSMEEAMTFVMTGGTNAPETVRFARPPRDPPA